MDTFFDKHEEHNCVIPEEPFNYAVFLFNGCILPVLVLTGCLNNILIIRVLCKMDNMCATVIILQALAASDILFLISAVVTWVVYSWYGVLGELCSYLENFTLAVPFLMGLFETACDIVVWVFVMFVVERYIALAYFVLKDSNCSPPGLAGGTVVVALSFLITTSFNIPALANYHIISETLSENGSSVVVVPTGLSTMANVGRTYYTLDCVINTLLPMAIVIVMTGRNFTVLSQRGRQVLEAHTSGIEDNDRSSPSDKGSFATVAALVCGLLFIVCEIPRVIEAGLILSERDKEDDWFLGILHICFIAFIMLQAISSFIKLFVYYKVSKEFKAVFGSLYFDRKRERKKRSVWFHSGSERMDEERRMVEDMVDDTEATKL